MRKLAFLLVLASAASAQQINPNQIQPAANNNYVLTTVTAHLAPSWQPATGGGTPVQITLPTSALAANTCTSATTVTVAGVVPPSGSTPGTVFSAVPEGNPAAVNGWGSAGGLVLQIWASAANQMSWAVCNQSLSSITPGALNADIAPASGGGGGGGGSCTISAPSGSWPSWLVPTASGCSLTVAASAIPNTSLANYAITLGSTGVALGGTISTATGFNAATATALAATPTLCGTGNAPTGILANGNATGCAAIGGGPSGGPTLQVNGTNALSQTLQNLQNTATVLFTNPSGGVINATVPTATTSALGVSYPDNVSLAISSGVLSLKPTGANTVLGFNGSNVFAGFTAGTNISLASGLITDTNPANVVASTLTANVMPVATGAAAIGNSGVTYATGSTILGSGTSSNVDGFGILSYTSATAQSYTFANTYATYPVCTATPQFDPGSGVRYYFSSLTTTGFTVTFTSAVTGLVNFHCFKRT